MRYQDYEIEDFLANKDFVEWVTNPTKEKDYFWSKWIENHPEKKPEFDQAILVIKTVYENPKKNTDLSYNRILNNVLKEEYSARSIRERTGEIINVNWLAKIAASIIFIIGVGSLLYLYDWQNIVDHSTVEQINKYVPKGRKLTFVLPDGTDVTLNSDSRVIYPESFEDKEKRSIILLGEAYFDVNHNPDKPFEVNTGDVTTVALGTSFNIQAYPYGNQLSVALISGKAKVKSTNLIDERNIFLTPGNKFILDKKSDEIRNEPFEINDEIAWKKGIIIFKKDNINTFIDKIEKWYGVNVRVEGEPIEEWKVTGRFDNLSLELLLESVQYIQDINYSIKDKNVVIQFKTQN